MRQALRLYQTVHLELKRGRQLAFQNPDGSFVSMVMLGGPMAAEAAPVQQEAAGWLPIETAPKDDREFLVGGYDEAGVFHQAISHNENPAVNPLRGWNHRNGPLNVRAMHWKPLDAPTIAALQPTQGAKGGES